MLAGRDKAGHQNRRAQRKRRGKKISWAQCHKRCVFHFTGRMKERIFKINLWFKMLLNRIIDLNWIKLNTWPWIWLQKVPSFHTIFRCKLFPAWFQVSRNHLVKTEIHTLSLLREDVINHPRHVQTTKTWS